MKVDLKTGRIAYHSYVFTERGGLDLIQYDFDGKVESRIEVRRPLDFSDCQNV